MTSWPKKLVQALADCCFSSGATHLMLLFHFYNTLMYLMSTWKILKIHVHVATDRSIIPIVFYYFD